MRMTKRQIARRVGFEKCLIQQKELRAHFLLLDVYICYLFFSLIFDALIKNYPRNGNDEVESDGDEEDTDTYFMKMFIKEYLPKIERKYEGVIKTISTLHSCISEACFVIG